MSECDIVSLDSGESSFLPKIVRFQNGQIQPNNENDLQFEAFVNPKTKNTIIAAATERMAYAGEESSSDLFYTLLAIRNKKTNKIRLVPVSNVSLNVHLPKVTSLLDQSLMNNSFSIRDLNKQFGSKRTKRRTEQLERMKMNVSHVEDELKQTVADIEVKPEELVVPKQEEVNSYRPPINRDASTVENVYKLKDMITNEELDSLNDLAVEISENPVDTEQLSEFAVDSINLLKQNTQTNLTNYKIILYIDAILKFFKLNTKVFAKKKLEMDPYPKEIIEKIMREYTMLSDNTRHRPLSMRDKATCYIIVLALLALNYKVDLQSLSKSISVGVKKLSEVSRILGAQPAATGKGKDKNAVVVLKLPLAALPTAGGRRKRK